MFNPQQLEGLARKVLDIIPAEMGQAPEALKSQIKATLARALQDMDVVTREEFDTQAAVLAKTRAKLDALEKRLSDWETDNKVN
ncbi:accessory factor UbiK family protein [Thiomicrospira sp. R3]|uniref:accessory factor UbiK family protein n=1 Tax=Thiomicrospira sp. R3 TaxID=3035472 RepID=UPI00259B0E1D|nr:accessory factor UbiK family protein [Thiomicrospira sp. R3]WFE69312.1 accessory factor UbiK family protein [Thiomicrospira sp. R3]